MVEVGELKPKGSEGRRGKERQGRHEKVVGPLVRVGSEEGANARDKIT